MPQWTLDAQILNQCLGFFEVFSGNVGAREQLAKTTFDFGFSQQTFSFGQLSDGEWG
jgi:hypothetical protein